MPDKHDCTQKAIAFSVTLADVLFAKAVAEVDAYLQAQACANYTVVTDHRSGRAVQYNGRLGIGKKLEPELMDTACIQGYIG